MKKIVHTSLVALALLFGVVSCTSPKEDSVFEESASQRVSKAISEYQKLLTSSTYGWVFDNYPGGSTQDYGGFTYTLQFTDTQVSAMLDIAASDGTVTSTYSIIPYGGPTLSFDESNNLLHAFAEPDETYKDGYRGDFEFVFMSHTDDEIIVTGRKYGDKLRLTRLKEPAADYMLKVRTNASLIDERGIRFIKVAGQEIDFSKSGRVISFEKDGQNILIPFNFTDKGIRFYQEVEIQGTKVQDLIYDGIGTFKDANNLFAIVLFTPPPIDFANSRWRFFANNSAQVSPKFINQYNEVHTQMLTEVTNLTLDLWERYMLGTNTAGRATGTGLYLFSYTNRARGLGLASMYHMDFFGDVDNPDLLHIEGKQSNTGSNFEPLLAIRKLLIDSSPYVVEKTANPKVVKMTSQKDPEVWLVIEKYWP